MVFNESQSLTINLDCRSVPVWLVWLKYLSWFLYSNELLMINQWEGAEMKCDLPQLPTTPATIAANFTVGHF